MPDMETLSRIFCANGSINRVKISGDMGHPCLPPFVMLNLLESMPSAKTRADQVVYRTITADRILPLNPNFSNVCWRYLQWILSNIFLVLRALKRVGSFVDSEYCSRLNILRVVSGS